MNRETFYKILSERLASEQKKIDDARAVTNAFLEALEIALCTDGQLVFQGFGTFRVRVRPGCIIKNPRTGSEIEVAASKYVTFRAGTALKVAVNGGREIFETAGYGQDDGQDE